MDEPSTRYCIKTQRLVLREMRMQDLAAFHKLVSNKDVMKYWSQPHEEISTTESYLKNMVSAPTNGKLAFAIVLPPSASNAISSTTPVPTATREGTLIGHAGTWHEPRNELVFMIDKPFWGQGYMTEVLASLVPVFWEQSLNNVWAEMDPENEASLKVLEKSGFRRMESFFIQSSAGEHERLRMELTNLNCEADDGKGNEGGDNRHRQGESDFSTGLVSRAVMRLSNSDEVRSDRYGHKTEGRSKAGTSQPR